MIDQFSNTIDNVLKHRKDIANDEWKNQEDERKKKEDLINSLNPEWKDLSDGWLFNID